MEFSKLFQSVTNPVNEVKTEEHKIYHFGFLDTVTL